MQREMLLKKPRLTCDRLHNIVEIVSEGPKASQELCVTQLCSEVGIGQGLWLDLKEFVQYRIPLGWSSHWDMWASAFVQNFPSSLIGPDFCINRLKHFVWKLRLKGSTCLRWLRMSECVVWSAGSVWFLLTLPASSAQMWMSWCFNELWKWDWVS